MDRRGKEKRVYPLSKVGTPYERFRALPEAERHLKSEWTLARLDAAANAISDNEAVQMMRIVLQQLYKYIHKQHHRFAGAKLQPWVAGLKHCVFDWISPSSCYEKRLMDTRGFELSNVLKLSSDHQSWLAPNRNH